MKTSLLLGAALAAGANGLAIEARQDPKATSASIPDGKYFDSIESAHPKKWKYEFEGHY